MTENGVSPVLGTVDVRASVAWFCEVLGCTCGPDGIFEPTPGDAVYGIVALGSVQIHLQIRRGPFLVQPRSPIECDVYLYVEDSAVLYERCILAGATVLRSIADSAYGLRDFVVETPDGHRIVIGTPIRP